MKRKESLNSDHGQQFHQYQQNEQRPLTSNQVQYIFYLRQYSIMKCQKVIKQKII